MLLRGGPGDGQVVPGGGETVVWRACLYEITPVNGQDLSLAADDRGPCSFR
ncbi:hypothetical protein ABZ671_17305 [Micromonospora sp. NPDC006766]|uniref:hypothetical protein n=1 Tax=Micromonospora sp. NPDC006766 TaxID=3154778 RepID=UPI0033FAC074